jgi:hypothetical protein
VKIRFKNSTPLKNGNLEREKGLFALTPVRERRGSVPDYHIIDI